MGKVWMLVTVVVLAMCMVAGCVGEAEKTYTSSEQLIDIGVNEIFVIALDCGDIGSGFSWRVSYDASMLDLLDSSFKRIEERVSEVFGAQSFKLKALKTGETEITMVYVHRWFIVGSEWVEEQLDKKVFTVNAY